MGIAKWLKGLDPDKLQRVYAGVRLLGAVLGRTSKAERIVAIMETVPGRVESLRSAVDAIGSHSDKLDDGTAGDVKLELNNDEVEALDDYFDLRNQTKRQLRRLWNRIRD